MSDDKKTKHSATDSDKCYEMQRKYVWVLVDIDEHPDDPIFKVDCIFAGDAQFPKHWTEESDDDSIS